MVAGALVLLEALPALAGVVVFAVELAGAAGGAVVVRNVVLLAVLLLVVAVGLALVARGLLAGRRWARSPAVTWQLLLVAVGGYVFAAPHRIAGAAILALAVATIVAVVKATPSGD